MRQNHHGTDIDKLWTINILQILLLRLGIICPLWQSARFSFIKPLGSISIDPNNYVGISYVQENDFVLAHLHFVNG